MLANPVINSILATGKAQLSFLKTAEILGFSTEGAYTSRVRGQFPVRTRQLGKRLVVFTSDLISYLETGISQAEQSVPQIIRAFKIKTGRPTKREQLTAQKLGLTVKELRAMPASGVKSVVGGLGHA